MPIFIYECPKKHVQEAIRRIAQANDPLYCEECGEQMKQVPAKPGKFVRGSGGWSSPA